MDPAIWAAVIAGAVGVVGSLWARSSARAQIEAERRQLHERFRHELDTLRIQQTHDLDQAVQESRSAYEVEILRRRLDAYQRLMSILKPLSLDGREAPDQAEARRLAHALTDWYADDGGLLLSPDARNSLLRLRRALLGRQPGVAGELKREYPPRADASRLRTQLATDVLTRRRPFEPETPDDQQEHPDA